jgi:hypothetical protein
VLFIYYLSVIYLLFFNNLIFIIFNNFNNNKLVNFIKLKLSLKIRLNKKNNKKLMENTASKK